MSVLLSPPLPAWALALVSSLHLSLMVLRHHRSHGGLRRWPLVFVSALMGAVPWVLPSLIALAGGLAGHLLFFVVSDRLALPPADASAGSSARPAAHTAARAGTRAAPPSPVPRATPSATGAPDPAATRGFVPVTVLARLDETPDIRTFRLSRPEGFAFRPGQFLTVRLRVDGRDHARCYSISSAPEVPGYLEISVKRQGLVSNALHAVARPGATLFVRPPAGHFVYPEDDDRPLVLLAAGVGITPLLSMLRHALASSPQRPVTLLQSSRTEAGLAFADELRLLSRRHPRFRWVPAVSGEACGPDIYPGRIDAQLLAAIPDLRHSLVYLCGPEAMIASLRDALDALGVPRDQVRFERFEAAVAAVGALARESRQAAGGGPGTEASAEGEAEVHFARSGVRSCVSLDASVLDAAESCGVDIPSLCRAGVCGTCRTRVSGEVATDVPLEPPEADAGYVLACTTRIRGACTVDA